MGRYPPIRTQAFGRDPANSTERNNLTCWCRCVLLFFRSRPIINRTLYIVLSYASIRTCTLYSICINTVPVSQALGYRQVLEHLDGGTGVAETVERVKARTRRFAKRQRPWVRNQMECQPLEWPEGESGEACCERLLGMLG